MTEFKAPKEATLLDTLQTYYSDCSKTTLRSFLKEGRVFINNECQKVATTLIPKNALIKVEAFRPEVKKGLKILFEDNFFVAVEKPSGLLSVASNFQKKQTAFSFLKEHYAPEHIFVVHRLDQDTSGVMIFAKKKETQEKFKQIFAAHDIERKYLALVEGSIASPKGTFKSYLKEDKNYVVASVEDPNEGELAITHFKVLKENKKCSLLEVTLETGKKNQIRVHCQEALHPIVGDKKYGAKTNPEGRLMLHAFYLSFQHPETGKKIILESKAPPAFTKIFEPFNPKKMA